MKHMGLLCLALLPLSAVAAAPAPAAVPAPNGQGAPKRFVLRVEKGRSATFTLRENTTTGFSWTAKYDPARCKVVLDHRPGNTELCGAPGEAVVTVTLLTDAPADLTLEYRRPWEKDAPPAQTLRYAIVPAK